MTLTYEQAWDRFSYAMVPPGVTPGIAEKAILQAGVIVLATTFGLDWSDKLLEKMNEGRIPRAH